MTAYTKRDTNERKDADAQSIAHRFQTHRNSYIYLGEIFLAYNARIWGRFQTGDNARVYLWQNFHST